MTNIFNRAGNFLRRSETYATKGVDPMTIHGAVIIEQGVTFAIVAVKPEVTRYTV